MTIFILFGLLLGALVVIFALQNITTITVTFLIWQIEGSLAVILVTAVAIGIIIAALLSLSDVIRKSFAINELKHRNDELKDELTDKKIEVEVEKSKLAATNAYLDEVEKESRG